jgi:hypothetical protein
MYLATSIWEAAIWGPNSSGHGNQNWIEFRVGLWWILYGLIAFSFIALYTVHQSDVLNFDFSGVKWKNVLWLSILVVGSILVFGVLEDFGCYLIWGLDTFDITGIAGMIHYGWTWGLPNFYYTALPGIIMIIASLWYSRRLND